MNILFIAYQFPPLNVGGSQRPFYFAKYLPSYGYNPIVVTLDPKDFAKVYEKTNVDESLANDLPDSVKIVNIPSDDLIGHRKNKYQKFKSIYFNIYRGSEGKYWKRNFNSIVPKIIENENIKAVLVTAPPFGILPLATQIAKKAGLPLIVDMRDAWSLWVSNPYPNYLNYLRTKKDERKILQMADVVIATSKQTINDFVKLHPSVDKNKYCYIPNGFDQELELDKVNFTPKQKIKIGYVGSFYYSPESRLAILQPVHKKRGHRMLQYVPRKEDWLYRSPHFFFKTIRALIDKYPEFQEIIEIGFAGHTPEWLTKMTADFGLVNIVNHHGFLNHDEVIKFQADCDFLLITSSKVINGRDYSIAGKTFEYLAAGKPLLAFVCDGAQKDWLKELGMAVILDPDECQKNVETLHEIIIEGIELNPNQLFIEQHTRRNLTKELAGVIDKLI